MSVYQVTVERTITTKVEVEAGNPEAARILAEDAAERGDYDDHWMNLEADAKHYAYGAQEVDQ